MGETKSLRVDQREIFAGLLEEHRGIVLKVATLYCHQPEDRAELVQEIAAQLWRAYPGYDPTRPFSTWMYRIALNVAISELRSRERRMQQFQPLDEAGADVAQGDTGPERERQVRALHEFIARLAPLDRALMLLYLEGMPQREIASMLGISEANVSTKVGRMKLRIRDEL